LTTKTSIFIILIKLSGEAFLAQQGTAIPPLLLSQQASLLIHDKLVLCLFDLLKVVKEEHGVLSFTICALEDISCNPCCSRHCLLLIAKEDIDGAVLESNSITDPHQFLFVNRVVLRCIGCAR
jgi:hypothetical protein